MEGGRPITLGFSEDVSCSLEGSKRLFVLMFTMNQIMYDWGYPKDCEYIHWVQTMEELARSALQQRCGGGGERKPSTPSLRFLLPTHILTKV